MRELDQKTLEFCMNEILRGNNQFTWEELQAEIHEIDELEEYSRILMIEREMRLKSLLHKWGYIDSEIDEILSMTIEQIEKVENEGGFLEWRKTRRDSLHSKIPRL